VPWIIAVLVEALYAANRFYRKDWSESNAGE
jgi:hypothetical protein